MSSNWVCPSRFAVGGWFQPSLELRFIAFLRFQSVSVFLRSRSAQILGVLERRGEVRRVRGGAVATKKYIHEASFEESSQVEAAAKSAIGHLAASLVRPGDTVVLDVGTTADAVANHLVQRTDLVDVTVITNGLNVAMTLEAALERMHVFVTGGALRGGQHSPCRTHWLSPT